MSEEDDSVSRLRHTQGSVERQRTSRYRHSALELIIIMGMHNELLFDHP